MKTRPAEVIEIQDSLANFWASEVGLDWFAGWMESRRRDDYAVYGKSAHDRRAIEVKSILGARAYWVSEEMTRLAAHAAHSMPAQPLAESDLPCPMGFLVFEEGVPIPDVHGKTVVCSAFRWSRQLGCSELDEKHEHGVDGVMWAYYTDMQDSRDDYVKQYKAESSDIRRRFPSRLALLGEDFEAFGAGEANVDRIKEHLNAEATREQLIEALTMMRRLPLALWTLMGQTIGEVSDHRQDRSSRRRLGKARSPLAESNVTVVRLRRPKHESMEPAGEPVDWTHRWIVSGHWRNQWLPSAGRHRLQWIAPFVKGPEDKPLKIKRRVHALVR